MGALGYKELYRQHDTRILKTNNMGNLKVKDVEQLEKIDLLELRTGDIALISGNGIISGLIDRFQKLQDGAEKSGEYSHSGIIRVRRGDIFITEAQRRGIVNNDFTKRYMNENYNSILILRPKMEIDSYRMVSEMMTYIGNSRYDFLNLILWQPIKILRNKWRGEKAQNTKKFICHEFTAHVYNKHFDNRVIFENETQVNSKDIYDNKNFEHFILK